MTTDPANPSPTVTPSFMDTWGHLVWMTPVCLAMTLFSAQWQFIVTFTSIELIQFAFHIKEHRPEHPLLTSIIARFAVASPILAATIVVVYTGFPHLIRVDRKLEMFALIGLQIGISALIHKYRHAGTKDDGAVSGLVICSSSAVIIGLLTWLT